MSDEDLCPFQIPTHTRRNTLKLATGAVIGSASSIKSVSAQSPDRVEWISEGRTVHSSPTVVDDKVFFGNAGGILNAVDPDTGENLWQFEASGAIESSPTVVDNTAFIGGGGWGEDITDTNLYAVNTKTGELQWNFETGGGVFSSPTVVDRTVFVGSRDTNLYAVNAETATEEWVFNTGGEVTSSPVVADGTVFVGSQDNTIYAVDAETGEQQWAREADISIHAPTVADNTVFFASFDGIVAGDAETGEKEWQFNIDRSPSTAPTVADGKVFLGNMRSGLYAVDADTGSEQWNNRNLAPHSRSLTVADDTIFMGSSSGSIHAVDASTGEEQWGINVPDSGSIIQSSPIVVDGTLYVGIPNNIGLYAIDAGVDGTSNDSGVRLGAFGHHDDWQHAGQSINIEVQNGSNNGQNGIGTIPVIATGGGIITLSTLYALARHRSNQSISKKDPNDSSEGTAAAATPESSDTNNNQLIGRFTEKVETAESKLEEAEQARQNRAYTRALQTAKTAIDAAKAARDTAEDLNGNRVDEAKNKIATASDLLSEVETEQKEYQSIKNSLKEVSTEIDANADQTGVNGQTHSVEKVKTLEQTLDEIHATASKYEFGEIISEVEELKQVCDGIREQIASTDRIPVSQVPKSVPSPPRLSLNYEDIEKGELIGSGGNADVYYSTAKIKENIILALKEPRIGGTVQSETIDRIVEEAETWQKLDDHDNIVSVVDYGSEPLPWIGMEYMDGGHLADRAEDFGFKQALWTAICITKAVRHAHRRGIAHLDLKPTNILFREVADAWDIPKVGDWGLSKHLLQHSKSVEGMSPHYAAPEQFDKDFGSADDITDIYQLGTVFYELFTGQPPFEGQTYRVMDKIKNEDPIPPSDIADIPPELDHILLTALAKDKAARYETVVYLRDELQELWDEHH